MNIKRAGHPLKNIASLLHYLFPIPLQRVPSTSKVPITNRAMKEFFLDREWHSKDQLQVQHESDVQILSVCSDDRIIVRIPVLRDHHNHPSIYASFVGQLNIRDIKDKAKAFEIIEKKLINWPSNEVYVVMGWKDSEFDISENELNSLKPVLIKKTSSHGFVMNDSAKEVLADNYFEILANYHNITWIERNKARVLKFLPKYQI